MIQWKRVRTATEWGFFYGIISWLLATGISNKIPGWGVWGIILSRTVMGCIIGFVRWDFPWWARGLSLGLGINIPMGLAVLLMGVRWEYSILPMLVTGMVFGLLIELSLRPRRKDKVSESGPDASS